jgi:hypothetical protein
MNHTFATLPRRYQSYVAERSSENLARLPEPELRKAAQARDERIAPLFRRWPHLSRHELAELTRLYRERIRVAKHLGRQRRRTPDPR